MVRLGFLFPPCGAEDELYIHGEALGDDVRIALLGVRISGGDDEHAPHHLSRTGAIENLALHARVLARLRPASAIWACTSGSFIDGLAHARRQAAAIGDIAGCPASSTSLAFVEALRHLGIGKVAILASYPEETARAFAAFLRESDIDAVAVKWLSAPSGPHAARLGDERLIEEAGKLAIPEDGALLIPDTAMPSMHLVAQLEAHLGLPVLTANQVSLWEAARLAGIPCKREGMGRLFAG